MQAEPIDSPLWFGRFSVSVDEMNDSLADVESRFDRVSNSPAAVRVDLDAINDRFDRVLAFVVVVGNIF